MEIHVKILIKKYLIGCIYLNEWDKMNEWDEWDKKKKIDNICGNPVEIQYILCIICVILWNK